MGVTRSRIAPLGLQRGLLYGALAVLAACALVALFYYVSVREVARTEIAGLRAHAALLAGFGERTSPEALISVLPRSDEDGRFYVVWDGEGRQLGGPAIAGQRSVSGADAGLIVDYRRAEGSAMAQAFAVSRPLRGGGRVLVARDMREARRFSDEILFWFLVATAGLVVLAIGAGLVNAALISRRVDGLASTMQSIRNGDLSRRLALQGREDEIDRLAGEINYMLDRIDQLMSGLRNVSDGIAHDLKTPINRLRARVEDALRGADASTDGEAMRRVLEQTIEDADGLVRTFDALLLVARLEARAISREAEHFEIGTLLEDVAELYQPVAEDAGMELRVLVATESGPEIVAHRQLLMQAIVNLVENAIKYARNPGTSGESGRIELSWRQRQGQVEIRVSDNGPGVPERERERALSRFGRLDESRSTTGFGIGLSLVRAVCDLHGGELRLEDNHPGLLVVLEVPIVPANGDHQR